MDERVWSISKIGAVRPSIKFEGEMRLVTVKDIDTNKTGKIWLDSRWKKSWHKFDHLHTGDLIKNLHELGSGYAKDTLNADSLVIVKCIHAQQTTLVDAEQPHEPLVISEKTYCKECNLLSKALQRHLIDVHNVAVFI